MKKKNVIVSGVSRKGNGHEKNDDRFLIKALDDGNHLLAVSDGMGGHPAGDVAAEDIINCLSAINHTSSDKVPILESCIYRAEVLIKNRVKKVPMLEGMGATATTVIINGERAWWVHIGDSRMYLLRNGILQQITRDHSFLQDLIDSGEISADDAAKHRMAHVLDQCVGCMDAGVDNGEFAIYPGDTILLCTDGLYRTISDSKIARIVLSEKNCSQCVERLLQASLKAGIPDDTTIIIAVVSG